VRQINPYKTRSLIYYFSHFLTDATFLNEILCSPKKMFTLSVVVFNEANLRPKPKLKFFVFIALKEKKQLAKTSTK
jgi:hypothetical protein